jgi:hypothetical protein
MLNACFFLVVAVLFPLPDLRLYPRLERAAAAGVPGVRSRYHLMGAATLWLLAGCAVGLAVRSRLPWNDLRLGVASPVRFAAGSAAVIAYAVLAMRQRRALLEKPERLRRMWEKHASAAALAPHTPAELRSFKVLAVSAGVCEEIVYRGFMIWFAGLWLGLWPAVIASSLLFGVAHGYLGKTYVLRNSVVGFLFALVAVGSASLWPAMALHAFVDLLGGDLGYRALRVEAVS